MTSGSCFGTLRHNPIAVPSYLNNDKKEIVDQLNTERKQDVLLHDARVAAMTAPMSTEALVQWVRVGYTIPHLVAQEERQRSQIEALVLNDFYCVWTGIARRVSLRMEESSARHLVRQQEERVYATIVRSLRMKLSCQLLLDHTEGCTSLRLRRRYLAKWLDSVSFVMQSRPAREEPQQEGHPLIKRVRQVSMLLKVMSVFIQYQQEKHTKTHIVHLLGSLPLLILSPTQVLLVQRPRLNEVAPPRPCSSIAQRGAVEASTAVVVLEAVTEESTRA